MELEDEKWRLSNTTLVRRVAGEHYVQLRLLPSSPCCLVSQKRGRRHQGGALTIYITLQAHTERVAKAESGPIPTHEAPQELKGGNGKNGVRGDKKQGTESKPKDTEKLSSA